LQPAACPLQLVSISTNTFTNITPHMKKYLRNAGLLSVLTLCLVCFSFAAQAHDDPSPPVGNELNYDLSGFSVNQAIPTASVFDVILEAPNVATDVGSDAYLNVTLSGHEAPAATIHDLYAAPPNYQRKNDGDENEGYGNLYGIYQLHLWTTGSSPGNTLPAPRYSTNLTGIDLDYSTNLTGIDLDYSTNLTSLSFALPGFTRQTSASNQNRVLRC